MITATIQKIDIDPSFGHGEKVYQGIIEGPTGQIRRLFTLGCKKSGMIDWATDLGAEEVTFKL